MYPADQECRFFFPMETACQELGSACVYFIVRARLEKCSGNGEISIVRLSKSTSLFCELIGLDPY
jgi:hypothetical protein